ncbi:MAG: hypothetical protein JWP30_381 [Homoserinimonas sp.]|nr:hypothetical protein [Homoserinimonas sp.]
MGWLTLGVHKVHTDSPVRHRIATTAIAVVAAVGLAVGPAFTASALSEPAASPEVTAVTEVAPAPETQTAPETAPDTAAAAAIAVATESLPTATVSAESVTPVAVASEAGEAQVAVAVAAASVTAVAPAVAPGVQPLVISGPTITSDLPDGEVGTEYSQPISYAGFNSWPWFSLLRPSILGSLPPGLALSGLNVVGTPTTAGSYSFTLVLRQYDDFFWGFPSQAASKDFTVSISSGAPVIDTTELASGWLTQPYNEGVSATGRDVELSVSGLPDGLEFSNSISTRMRQGSNLGLISGTPTETGTFDVVITATNDAGGDSGTVTLTVNAAPVITTPHDRFIDGVTAAPFEYDIDAEGTDVSYSIDSDEFVIDSQNGVVTGSPDTEGNETFTVTATNLSGSDAKTFTVTLHAIPVISTKSLSNAVIGGLYTDRVLATGLNSTFSVVEGTLPAGLTLDPDGTIKGSVSKAGEYTFAVQAANYAGTTAVSYTLMVTKPVDKLSTSTANPGGTVTVSASGFLQGEQVEIWLHSTPIHLTTVTTDENGAFSAQVTIPFGAEVGKHNIISTGLASGASVSSELTIAAAPVAAGIVAKAALLAAALPTTGAEIAPVLASGALLASFGVFLTVVSRRRKVTLND